MKINKTFFFTCVLLLSHSACTHPFSADRHDLLGFRIAAATVQDGIGDAMIWGGGHLYHQKSPRLRWYVDQELVAYGFQASLPEAEVYRLEVENQYGEILRAEVVPGQTQEPFEIERFAVELHGEFSVDERREKSPKPLVDDQIPTQEARLVADIESDQQMRWMTAFSQGTLLELEFNQADLLPYEVVMEDETWVRTDDRAEDFFSILGLAIDGVGGNQWAWIDVSFTEDTYLRHNGHLLSSDKVLRGEQLVAARIELVDEQLFFVDVEPVADNWQQDELSCAEAEQPFDMGWVRQGRCSLEEILSTTVVLEIW